MPEIDLSQLPDKMPQIDLSQLPDKMPNIDLSQLPDKIDLSQLPDKQTSVLQGIADHPFRAILDPVSKTMGGKSVQDIALDKTKADFKKVPGVVEYWDATLKNAIAGMGGSVVDMAQTPASYIPIPFAGKIAKFIGKIPVKGSTLAEVATKVPVGKGFSEKIAELSKIPSPQGTTSETILNAGIDTLGRKPETLPLESSPTSNQVNDQNLLGFPLPENIPQELTPVQKITAALKEAQPIRDEQEHLYSAERSKRAAAIEDVAKTSTGESGFYSQLRALKGELPKVTFKGIRDKVAQPDIDSLFNDVQRNAILSPYEKITAKNGLVKLLGVEGGGVPNNSELNALREVFPSEFIQTVLEKRPFIEKFGDQFSEALNIPRSLMSSFDLSAPLRQGIFMVGRPKQFLPAFGNMFKYFGDEKAYEGLIEGIKARPNYPLMRQAKLPLSSMEDILSNREEAFISRLPEKIPLLGEGIKGSNRAYTGFLNKLRADVFDDLISKAQTQGVELTPKVLKNIGEFVGAATGRGKLPGRLEPASRVLSDIFFSPRLIASRMTLLNPQFYTKLDPFTRKEALKSLFTFTSTASTVLALASLGGAKVGTDIRSADFGKIRMGNTRYDILGGFQQYIRLAGQLITGQQVSSTTNVPMTLGEGYKSTTRLDILGRFVESKLAPVPSFIDSILKGKTFEGENMSVTEEVAKRFVPMIIQDMTELYKEKGFEGIGMSIPSIFGVSTQTYKPSPQELIYSSKSVLNYSKKLMMQGKIEEGKKFYEDNKDIVEAGLKLQPYQKTISDLEKAKEQTEKYVLYSPQQKKEMIYNFNQKINQLHAEMDAKATELVK